MRSLAVAGLCLIAATAVCVIGSLIDSPRLSSVAWALGAGTAFAGAATGYGAITGSARRGGLPATGLALLGVAASLWIVEATLRITVGGGGLVDRVLPVLAAVASGVGFAVVAVATWRARLVRPAIGRVLAATAILGALAADPAVPYVLGAAPLGIGLLLAGKQRTTRREQTQ